MKLHLIVIRSANQEQTMKFYQLFGLEFDYHCHGNGPMHYSTTIDETVFEIYPLLKSQTIADTSLRLGFKVAQLDILIQELRVQKIQILQEPKSSEWGYFAVIKDPDGRKIELTQEN